MGNSATVAKMAEGTADIALIGKWKAGSVSVSKGKL
jgi:hypothetical protein